MRKSVLAILIAVIVVSLISVLVMVNLGIIETQKTEVNNFRISQISSDTYLKFYVTNKYNSPLMSIGLTLNDVSCGYHTVSIPAGQTLDASIRIPESIELASSAPYNIKLTFSFEDSNYENFATTLTYGQVTTPYPTNTVIQPTTIPTLNPTSTPVPIPIEGQGKIAFIVKDQNGNNLTNTIVATVTQPVGMRTLFDLTNSTGCVTFNHLAIGEYTFRFMKDGYQEKNQTINFKGTPMTLTITLNP